MKEKDPLFKALHQKVFRSGDQYDGLRVRKVEDFNLDLLLSLPKYAEPELTTSNLPGFVHLKLQKYDAFMRQPEAQHTYRTFRNLFDHEYYLDTQKVLAWMQGIVQRTLNDFPQNGTKRILTNASGSFEVIFHTEGPALTLKISGSGAAMDVDLVACFVFREDKWPQNGFKPNLVKSKPEFFIVSKQPKFADGKHAARYWRLSFQEQESVLIDKKRTLKPTIKLLKKMRDTLQHKCIASYYIKTVVLHLAETKDDEFWRNPLSYVFMAVLKEYKECIEKGNIPYYWNKNNNLIEGLNPSTLQNMVKRLNTIISDIERRPNDPNIVAKYLLNSEEYRTFINRRMLN